jgi:hypothetical protein
MYMMNIFQEFKKYWKDLITSQGFPGIDRLLRHNEAMIRSHTLRQPSSIERYDSQI